MAETKSGLPKLLSLGGFLRKDIECLVCQDIMTAKILQCRNGHCVCQTCYSRLKGSCPCCRVELDKEPIRNRLAESFCREILVSLKEKGAVDENGEEIVLDEEQEQTPKMETGNEMADVE